MEEKQGVFNPPQVLKLPPSSHSRPWFNPQPIRAAANCEPAPSLSLLVFTLGPRDVALPPCIPPQTGTAGKELSQQGHLVAALHQLVANKP